MSSMRGAALLGAPSLVATSRAAASSREACSSSSRAPPGAQSSSHARFSTLNAVQRGRTISRAHDNAGAARGGPPSSPSVEARAHSDTASSSATEESSDLEAWQTLIHTEERTLNRAWSPEDAHALRRKGHLKEQDALIEFVIELCKTHTLREAMEKLERWATEHRKDPLRGRLRRNVPTLGEFFTALPLTEALNEYDAFCGLSRRRHVPPNFAEVRHVLNIAQVRASGPLLRMITFDADGTLYADGAHFEQDNGMIRKIISLLQSGIHVGIVTAAGYPGEAHRFEGRLKALLAAFRDLKLEPEVVARFHVMGGECNYLLRVTEGMRLEFVPPIEWQTEFMLGWTKEQVASTLDAAESILRATAKRLTLPVEVIRKERACGVIPKAPVIYETLEELALAVQEELSSPALPFCAFNGGNDVFVDIGNKSLGLQAIQRYLGFRPDQMLHVGDRFTLTGNDNQVRGCCPILWVANPDETQFFVQLLLQDILHSAEQAGSPAAAAAAAKPSSAPVAPPAAAHHKA